jgi:hypothetical protein
VLAKPLVLRVRDADGEAAPETDDPLGELRTANLDHHE